MEFRLSANTVNSYDTYTKERARYAGSNGADGGNWQDLKQWLIANGFECAWQHNIAPTQPVKNESTVLWQQIYAQVQNTIKAFPCLMGVTNALYDSLTQSTYTNGCHDGESGSGSPVYLYSNWNAPDDAAWTSWGNSKNILLVRPYL